MTGRRKSDKVEGRSFRKDDLLRMTARMAGVRWDVTEKVINCLFAALRQYIMDTPEGRIGIREFGTFYIDKKEAYEFEGIKSKGGKRERILLPARKRIRFKPGGVLEEHCNSFYVVPANPKTSWDPPDTEGLYNPSTEESPMDLVREEVMANLEQTGESMLVPIEPEPVPAEKDYFKEE